MLATVIFSLLNPPKKALVFTCLQYKSFVNTEGKGQMACNEQFFLFPQCFLYVKRAFRKFEFVVCKLLAFGKEPKICRLGKG